MTPAIALCLLLPGLQDPGPGDLRVGNWVEIRGELDGDTFVASKVEVLELQRYELLIGTVESADERVLLVLDQPVHLSERVEWDEGLRPSNVEGRRLKIEGRWRGPGKLSAREISSRGPGRERIGGRLDSIEEVDGGWLGRLMRYRVFLPDDVQLVVEGELGSLALAEPREITAPEDATLEEALDDDDLFGDGVWLTGDLRLEGQLETRTTSEGNLNLDRDADEDRLDEAVGARLRLVWQPTGPLDGVVEARVGQRWRDDEEDGSSSAQDAELGETFLRWSGAFGARDVSLAAGRQDFDDVREWIYDQNLDAVSLAWDPGGLRLELSVSTTLADGDRRDLDSTNWVAYLSNGDRRRHLAAWTMLRSVDTPGAEEESLFVGARAVGRWLPDTRLWADAAWLGGERGEADLSSFGYDVGATWSPPGLAPLRLTAGYALGRGDRRPGSGTDRTFRQTGYQDNNAKLGGVTSIRYYGELVDPELSNLGVLTLGLGTRLAEDTSLELVFHDYVQDVASNVLVDTDLDADPSGDDPDLGRELDLVFGWRALRAWDVEVVAAYFEPGDAFPGAEAAWLAKVQLRWRF